MAESQKTPAWLRLSETAQLLGVHPSTVRKWADQGVLPVQRTEGGHRRFLRHEIEIWRQAQRTEKSIDVDLVMQNALRNTRMQIGEGSLEAEDWYRKLDSSARQQYRTSGRVLLQGMNNYLVSENDAGVAEARAVGYEYASRGRRCGLDSTEAAKAFLFFRSMLVEAMLDVYESAAVRSPHAWSEMFRKVNEYTDQILLTILKTYEAFQKAGR